MSDPIMIKGLKGFIIFNNKHHFRGAFGAFSATYRDPGEDYSLKDVAEAVFEVKGDKVVLGWGDHPEGRRIAAHYLHGVGISIISEIELEGGPNAAN